jgi:hypothetical protein
VSGRSASAVEAAAPASVANSCARASTRGRQGFRAVWRVFRFTAGLRLLLFPLRHVLAQHFVDAGLPALALLLVRL